VGKSALINALVRQRLARTSAAPGKTRLANIYRVTRERARSFYLVDLPGYGFARGGRKAAHAFDELTTVYFGRVGREGSARTPTIAALLLIDARHPGLESDVAAWRWLRAATDRAAIAATKIDKLARGERIRALRELESVHQHPVQPVSAVTGEGLEDLWKLIDTLVKAA
jgi:GTP-binding protein